MSTNLPINHQNEPELILATFNDTSKDWLYRILASAEMQYRTLQEEDKS